MNRRVAKGLLDELEHSKDSPAAFGLWANIGMITALCWPEWNAEWHKYQERIMHLNYAPVRKGEHQVFVIGPTMQEYYNNLNQFLYTKAYE